MRAFVLILALAAADPAFAQPFVAHPFITQPFAALTIAHDAQYGAEAMAARNRDVILTNQISVLEARLQADQAVSNLQAQRITPPMPAIELGPNTPPPVIDAGQFAQIPDATLARSNAAVRAAANNRR